MSIVTSSLASSQPIGRSRKIQAQFSQPRTSLLLGSVLRSLLIICHALRNTMHVSICLTPIPPPSLPHPTHTHNRYCGTFYLRLSRRRSRNCRFFLLLNLLTNEFRKANRPKVSTPKGIRKCVLTMTKTLVRSDLASEAIWRPKQPQRFCLKISGCL